LKNGLKSSLFFPFLPFFLPIPGRFQGIYMWLYIFYCNKAKNTWIWIYWQSIDNKLALSQLWRVSQNELKVCQKFKASHHWMKYKHDLSEHNLLEINTWIWIHWKSIDNKLFLYQNWRISQNELKVYQKN
jgi:hypothetical protein